jgi:hypothetical protein
VSAKRHFGERFPTGCLLVIVCVSLLSVVGCRKDADHPVHLKESDYQNAWIKTRGGHGEVRMRDGTRADIITASHAIEVDFAEKWAESIGQSLHYAGLRRLKAGVLLIVDEEDDVRYLKRWQTVVADNHLAIDLFLISPEFEITEAP